jgi:hypothetical protein
MAFYELRMYAVRPGKMDEWAAMMDSEIIPFQVSHGMIITASFRGETDDGLYVWMRRFEDEAQRVSQYQAVYESDHWKQALSPRIALLIERETIRVERLVPTGASVLR